MPLDMSTLLPQRKVKLVVKHAHKLFLRPQLNSMLSRNYSAKFGSKPLLYQETKDLFSSLCSLVKWYQMKGNS